MIILTSEEASVVRGISPSMEGQALLPIELDDGRFFLDEEILNSPAHADVAIFLQKLPKEDLKTINYKRMPEDEGFIQEKIIPRDEALVQLAIAEIISEQAELTQE